METKKGEAMASKMLKSAQQMGQQIIEQARKQANDEATETLKMVEEKGQQIIMEAARFAEAKAAEILAQAQQEAREIVVKAQEQAQSHKSGTTAYSEEKIGHTTSEPKNGHIESQLGTTSQTLDKGFGIIIEATKKAETEAGKIIAQAKEAGRQIIEEATRKREDEAKKIVIEAEETRRQIIEEATRKADDEGNKIVTKALQTGLNIIVEAARIADTEIDKTKRISQEGSKEHRLIEEAKAAAINGLWTGGKYRDGEHVVQHHPEETKDSVLAEVSTHQEIAYSVSKVRSMAELEKNVAAAAPLQTPKSVLEPVKEKAKHKMKTEVGNQTAIYQGQVEITIMPPIDFIQLEKLRISLQSIRNMRILSTEGYSDGRTTISVLLNRPSHLITDLIGVEEVEEALGEETLDSHPIGKSLKKTFRRPWSLKRNNCRRILLVLRKMKQ